MFYVKKIFLGYPKVIQRSERIARNDANPKKKKSLLSLPRS